MRICAQTLIYHIAEPKLLVPSGSDKSRSGSVLLLDGVARRVPFRFVWLDRAQANNRDFGIAFNAENRLRRAPIFERFTGAYRVMVDHIHVPHADFDCAT